VQVYSLYAGLFFAVQAVLSPYVAPHTYIVRPAHLNLVVDVVGDNLRGISGRQRLTTDARGFRTTKAIDYEHKEGFRIFFIGASSVAQEWIDDRSTFAHLLQESLSASLEQDVQAINTAVQGTRAIHMLTTMERVAHLNPDMYVIVPGANDWGLQIATRFDGSAPDQFDHAKVHVGGPQKNRLPYLNFLRRYSLEHTLAGRVLHKGWVYAKAWASSPNEPSAAPTRQNDPTASFYAHHRGSLFKADQRTFTPATVSDSYADVMTRMVEFCQASPAACVLTTHPHSYKPGITREYMDRFWMTPAYANFTLTLESMRHIAEMYNRYTSDVARDSGLPVCDLETQIEPSLSNFYDEMHFNLEGSRKAASVLHPCLEEVIRSHIGASAD